MASIGAGVRSVARIDDAMTALQPHHSCLRYALSHRDRRYGRRGMIGNHTKHREHRVTLRIASSIIILQQQEMSPLLGISRPRTPAPNGRAVNAREFLYPRVLLF